MVTSLLDALLFFDHSCVWCTVFWQESLSRRSHMQEGECLFCKGFCPWLSSFITTRKTFNPKGPCSKTCCASHMSLTANSLKMHSMRAKKKKWQVSQHLLTLMLFWTLLIFHTLWRRAVKLQKPLWKWLTIVHMTHALYLQNQYYLFEEQRYI